MKITVIKSDAATFGGFWNKLVNSTKVDAGALGTISKKRTYYVNTDAQLTVGAELEVNMDLFDVVESKVTVDIEGVETEVLCSKLVLKAQ